MTKRNPMMIGYYYYDNWETPFLFLGVWRSFGILCLPLVTFYAVIITFYQRMLLGTSANQKIHYLKSYNNVECLTNVSNIYAVK